MPPRNEMTKPEKINLMVTILGPIVILGAIAVSVWCVNARVTIEVQAEDKKNAETYVSKEWFEKSQDDTTKHLSDLSINVGNLTTAVAEMKGELSVKQNTSTK